jgi:hypothetical protein
VLGEREGRGDCTAWEGPASESEMAAVERSRLAPRVRGAGALLPDFRAWALAVQGGIDPSLGTQAHFRR